MKTDSKLSKVRNIKREARGHLLRCWAELAFIYLLNAGVYMGTYLLVIIVGKLMGIHEEDNLLPVFSSLPPVFIFIIFVIVIAYRIFSTPLVYGIKWYFWQISAGAHMPVSSVFACYTSGESMKRFVKLRLLTDIKKTPLFLFMAVQITAGLMAADHLFSITTNLALRALLNLGCLIIIVGSMILFIIFNAGFIPVPYLMAENSDMDMKTIFKKSGELTHKKHALVFTLYSTFGLWYAVSFMIFPLIFFAPYIEMTTALLVRELLTGEDEEAERKEEANV